MQKYSGAVAARPRVGFARDVIVGGTNLVLTRVVTAPKCPARYVIDIVDVADIVIDSIDIVTNIADIAIDIADVVNIAGIADRILQIL